MRKRRIDRGVVVLLFSTLLTLAVWVGFEIYWAYTKVQIPEGVENYLTPLTPTLDTNALDRLERRTQ